jgi:hypothetical protein
MPIVIAAITAGIAVAGTVTKNLIKNQMEAKEFEPFCGKRPVFTGKRRDTWNECVRNLPEVIPVTVPAPPTGQPPTGNNGNLPTDTQTVILPTDTKKLTTNQKLLIGGSVAVGLLLIYKLYKRN